MISEISHTTPTARKPHRCFACWVTIQPGETYDRSVLADYHTAWTIKSCLPCSEAMQFVQAYWEWPEEGVGEEEYHEWAWHASRADSWATEEERTAATTYLNRRNGENK
ncbi:hypothetical protein OS125_11470 [Corynebacterium sp. P7003]|uniref:Uncharacterized protein n=1 Tax=Corynebacterium pygosceleis TaxID=2800406 RepID=A0ABT3WX99_9CORY|nr:hypothetical protein [Corynebacterium pygosceleis]MCX7445850.1 hypothetical protein [Corynebacterium pygosceleis]